MKKSINLNVLVAEKVLQDKMDIFKKVMMFYFRLIMGIFLGVKNVQINTKNPKNNKDNDNIESRLSL